VLERRLAISIKGGVSLGAYKAGALTGASAGSITTALVTMTLINNRNSNLQDVWRNVLSLETLSPTRGSRDPAVDYYLLDASKLDDLAANYFPFQTNVLRHSAIRPGDAELRLRFTLSRVNPLVTAVSTRNGDTLNIEEHAATASFSINFSSDDALTMNTSGVAAAGYSNPNRSLMGRDAWTALQQAAIASGSFPLAFAPRVLRTWNDQHLWGDTFFIDGGLFDNDPVRGAINLAHDIDWYSTSAASYDDSDRRFMVVHAEPYDRAQSLSALPDPYTWLTRIVKSLLTETKTSGLSGIPAVNDKFKERGNFLQALANQFSHGDQLSIPPGVLEQLAKWRGIDVERHLPVLQGALVPDLQFTDPDTYIVVKGFAEQVNESFTDIALAMDFALNVADKVRLSPILIEPKQDLSGNPLFGFAGFLVKEFRVRDFEQGRYDAWQTWNGIAQSQSGEFMMPRADDSKYPPPIVPEDPRSMLAANRTTYDANSGEFYKRVSAVAENILTKGQSPGPIGNIAARSILNFIARKALERG
jgi:hypothetical protein